MYASNDLKSREWKSLQDITGVEPNLFQEYLGKISDEDFPSIQLEQFSERAVIVFICGGGSWEAKYALKPEEGILFIDKIERAYGLGVEIFSRILELGNKTNLFSKVELRTNWSGSHVWQRYGFLPTQREWDSLRTKEWRLPKNCLEIESGMKGGLKDNIQETLRQMLSESEPTTIRKLAALEQRVCIENGPSGKLRHLVFRGDPGRWYGSFELDDEEAINTFENYKREKQGRA